MKYNKYGKGWFKESHRHRLARLGVKTGRKNSTINYTEKQLIPERIRKITKYVGDKFEFSFMPVEDTLSIKKTKDGFEARYLVQDNDAESPDSWGDNSLFLVHYHRDFDVRNDNIITDDDARDWYQGNKIEQEKDYWIIPVEAYIHSGVTLAVQNEGCFPDRRWDVSHVGLALASKKEFDSKENAEKAIRGLIKTWNQYLSGDVYGIVKEKYDENKKLIDTDSVWGNYGFDNAKKELKATNGYFT